MRVPHDEVGSIVSQPSARELPGTVAPASRTARPASGRTGAARPGRRARRAARRARTRRRRAPCRTGPRVRRRRRAPPRSCREPRRRAPSAAAIVGHRDASARRGVARRRSSRRRAAWRASVRLDGRDAIRGRPRTAVASDAPAAIRGEKPEQDEPEIAVDRLRPRRVLERHRADVVLELAAPAGGASTSRAGRPDGVLEQIVRPSRARDRRRATPETTTRTGSSRRCSPSVHELHHDRRRRDRLGQRREVERRRCRAPAAPSSKVSVPSASRQSTPVAPTSTAARGTRATRSRRRARARAVDRAHDAGGASLAARAELPAASDLRQAQGRPESSSKHGRGSTACFGGTMRVMSSGSTAGSTAEHPSGDVQN